MNVTMEQTETPVEPPLDVPPMNGDSIAERLANTQVRYWMEIGRFSWVPKDSHTVPLVGGGFGAVPQGGMAIERSGFRRMAPWTQWYDPANNKEHAALVASLDQLIEENPWLSTDIRYGIRKWEPAEAGMPFGKWNTASTDEMYKVYQLAGWQGTLEDAYRYETAHQNRADVIELIEAIDRQNRMSERDMSSDGTVDL